MTTIFQRLLIGVLILPAGALAQAGFHDLDALDREVAAAAHVHGLVTRPVDRRLRLVACPMPVEVAGPIAQAMTVRCVGLGWRIRVPLDGTRREAGIEPIVIRRGDPVTVEYRANGFALSAQAVAEGDAQAGDRVRVRIDPKNPPITAEAVSEGVARFRR